MRSIILIHAYIHAMCIDAVVVFETNVPQHREERIWRSKVATLCRPQWHCCQSKVVTSRHVNFIMQSSRKTCFILHLFCMRFHCGLSLLLPSRGDFLMQLWCFLSLVTLVCVCECVQSDAASSKRNRCGCRCACVSEQSSVLRGKKYEICRTKCVFVSVVINDATSTATGRASFL